MSHIKGFQLIRHLAEGTFAEIYLVKEIGSENIYAAKVFDDANLYNQSEVNVNRYLGTLIFEFSRGFIMSYEEGDDLFSCMKNLNGKNLQITFYKSIKALEHLHSMHLVHFDLKPENIYLTKNGDIKLLDFGFTRTWDKDTSYRWEIPLVNGKESAGTVYYAAPEIFRKFQGNIVNYPAVDIYSLGLTFYSIIEKRYPYSGENEKEYLKNILSHRPLLMTTKIESRMRDLIMRMIDIKPHNRPSLSSAIEIMKFLCGEK